MGSRVPENRRGEISETLLYGKAKAPKRQFFFRKRAEESGAGTDFSAEKPPRAVVFSAMLRYAEELAHTRGDAGSENVRWLLARLHPFTCGVPGGKAVRAALREAIKTVES